MSHKDYSIYTFKKRTFGWPDYVVFAMTLVISAGIGLFYAIKDRRRQNLKEFMVASRSMNVLPVALSLGVTFMSALTLLGTPTEIYNYHTMFWWLMLAHVLSIGGAAHIFVPFFYKLNLISMFEYLEMRFNKAVRVVASVANLLQLVLYFAFVLYAPSLALSSVTNFNLWGSVAAVGLVVTIYTALGGMKAVVWTDTFQSLMIAAGLLAVLIQGSIVNEGFANAWRIAENRSRVIFDDFSGDPGTRHSFWSVVIGGGVFWLSLYGINQAQVQRAISCPSVRKAQLALWINLPVLWIIVGICCMIGIVMFAFYSDCHPVTFGLVSRTDQLLPLFVMDILGKMPGLPGVFLSCLFSGSLSTLSSGLNAVAAVTLNDVIRPFCCLRISEMRATIYSKIIICIFGLVSIALAYSVSKMGALLQAAYAVFGIINGPLVGFFILGMFFPWVNTWGVMIGAIVSLAFMSWIGMGAFVNKIRTPPSLTIATGCNWTAKGITTTLATTQAWNLTTVNPNAMMTTVSTAGSSDPFVRMYKLSYLYYTPTGILVMIIVGLIVSFLTGYKRPRTLDPKLYCSLGDILLPFLPKKFRRILRCGVLYEEEYEAQRKEKTLEEVTNGGAVLDTKPQLLIEEPKKKQLTEIDNPAFVTNDDAIVTRL